MGTRPCPAPPWEPGQHGPHGASEPHGPAPGSPPTSQDLHFLVLLFLNSCIEVRLAHANPPTVRTYGRAGFEHVRGRKSPPVHPL